MRTLALAWRNVLRSPRRSAITVLSIALGLAALTFVWAFIDGMNEQMIVNSTRMLAGDMQVHLQGFHDDPSPERTLTDSAAVLASVRADPNVAAATVRLEGTALASGEAQSRGVRLMGVDPDGERGVSELFGAVVAGQALRGDTAAALIGEDLASSLGLQVGDDLVLVGQAFDGSIASAKMPVAGIFRTGVGITAGFTVVLPLKELRTFLAAGEGASAVVLRLRERGELDPTRQRISAALGPDHEVLGWPRLLPEVAMSARFHDVTAWTVLAVYFGIVAAAVANPVLMSVLERTREFGIVLALGMTRGQMVRLVLTEATLLGLAGLLAGNLLGLAVTGYFATQGIDLSAFGSALRTMPGLEDVTYPLLRLERSLMVSAIVFVTACLAALYPAAKAASLNPVEAIRGLVGSGSTGGGLAGGAAWRAPVFVRIAARNVLRNRRRTAITAGGTAFGIAAFVFLFGYFDGFGEELVDNSTRYLTGHAQVERAGWRRDLAPELAFDGAGPLLTALRALPAVEAAAPRVQMQALASTATRSEGVMLIGVDPPVEAQVTFIDRTVVEGQALADAEGDDIVIGRELATRLGVRVGEKLILMTQAADGALGTHAFRVRGVFATESSSFDRAIAYVGLGAAQSVAGLGRKVTNISLRLRDRAELPKVMPAIAAQAAAAGGLQAVAWQELLPQVDQMNGLTRVLSDIVLAMAFFVVVMGIVNTVYMAVAERTREIGVMMALGTPAGAIRRMILYETTFLMLLASLLGYGAGIAMVGYFARHGIDLSGFFRGYASVPGLTGIVHPKLIPQHIVVPGLILFVASVLVSLLPASRAARLEPTVAMRHA